MKKPVYRHGELLFIPVLELPVGLKKAKTQVIATGSHGNNHVVKNCDIYFQKEGEFVIGYLRAKIGNELLHPEHSPTGCSLPVGLYEIRTQFEVTNSGMVQVID